VLGQISLELTEKFLLKYKDELAVLQSEIQNSGFESSNLEMATEKRLYIPEN
jgi:hypothetical protein